VRRAVISLEGLSSSQVFRAAMGSLGLYQPGCTGTKGRSAMDQIAAVSASRFSRRGLIKGLLGTAAVAVIAGGAVTNASANGDGVRYITTTAVNLRKSSSTSSKVLLVVPEGAIVIDYDQVMQNGFRGVDYNGTVGWIYDDYLILEADAGPIAFTTTTAVNLRKGPSTSSQVIKVLPAGAKVIDYDLVIENGYRGVDYNGTVGWVYADYLA
jgi:uncharacterized protein YraI